MKLIKGLMIAAVLLCTPALAGCFGPGASPRPASVAGTVSIEATRAVVLANRAYLIANGIAQGLIASNQLSDADLDKIAMLDVKINLLLDQATAATDVVVKAAKAQEAFTKIFEYEDILKKGKKIGYRNDFNDRGPDHRTDWQVEPANLGGEGRLLGRGSDHIANQAGASNSAAA